MRFEYGPILADAIVSLSSTLARLRLFKTGPKSVLVDNTVLSHAITHETGWISTGMTSWGTHQVDTGYSARILVRRRDTESREYRNVSYLPGMVHLARVGQLSLMTSAELCAERFRQPVGRFSGYGIFDHGLFVGIEMESVDGFPETIIGPKHMNLPSSEEQQRERLARSTDPLYLGLVRQLGPSNTQDAWHISTAELHGMFCFLTMDFALCRNFNGRRDQEPIRSLRTKVMTPLQLGQYLGLFPVRPALFSYTSASYPVRPDLHWPDGKRRRPGRTRSS